MPERSSNLDIGFRLWDGSTVPDDLDPEAFAIRFADEGLIASLLRSPKPGNPAQSLGFQADRSCQMATCSIWWRGGRRFAPANIRKQLSKFQVLNTGRKFLFLDKGGPWPLSDQPDEKPSDGNAEENQKNIAYHYDVSNAFYKLFLDDQMVYTCGYCTDWDNDITRCRADKLEMICRKLRLKPVRPCSTSASAGARWRSTRPKITVCMSPVSRCPERQLEYATQRLKRLGLRTRVNFHSYRLCQG
jgi:cyclopropane-fatty-acyl-phospholipid synthase